MLVVGDGPGLLVLTDLVFTEPQCFVLRDAPELVEQQMGVEQLSAWIRT